MRVRRRIPPVAVLVVAVVALSAPVAQASAPLPGSAYEGKGRDWKLNVAVRPDPRKIHVDLWVPMRCVSRAGGRRIRQTYPQEFQFTVSISADGTVRRTWHRFERKRSGLYKGEITRESVRLRGRFDGDRVSLRVKASSLQAIGDMSGRCWTVGGTRAMHADRYFPAFRVGTYAGTTSEGLAVGPVHLVYPGGTDGNEVYGAVDRFAIAVRLPCSGPDRAGPPQERVVELPTGRGLRLLWNPAGYVFTFKGRVGDLDVTVWASFDAEKLHGNFEAAPAGEGSGEGTTCRTGGTYNASWRSG